VMKEESVNIFGEPHEVRAEVVVLNSFSAHADRDELLSYAKHFDRKVLKSIFLVHGDLDQCEKFAGALQGTGFSSVGIPVRGEKVPLHP
jgi:metallo-beta-lactamase family protein